MAVVVQAVEGDLGLGGVDVRVGVVTVVAAGFFGDEAVTVGIGDVRAVAVLVDLVVGGLRGTRVGVGIAVVAVVAVVTLELAVEAVFIGVEVLVDQLVAVVVDGVALFVGVGVDPVVVVVAVDVVEVAVVVLVHPLGVGSGVVGGGIGRRGVVLGTGVGLTTGGQAKAEADEKTEQTSVHASSKQEEDDTTRWVQGEARSVRLEGRDTNLDPPPSRGDDHPVVVALQLVVPIDHHGVSSAVGL